MRNLWNQDISEFDIPSDYTKIGHGAFGKCSLTKVIIPNIAEIIGKNVLFVWKTLLNI